MFVVAWGCLASLDRQDKEFLGRHRWLDKHLAFSDYRVVVELRERKTVRGQVTARLFQAIVAGELRPGDRIIETKLASQLGVGQSTLREALQDLEYRELVKKEANRGTYVTVLTSKAVKDMYAVRLELEPMAAELAKKNITNKHLAQLREMVTEDGGSRPGTRFS